MSERFPDEVLREAHHAYTLVWDVTLESSRDVDRANAAAIAAMRAVLEGHLAAQETEPESEAPHHYDGPIDVGMEFWWMPRTRAQERVTVTRITRTSDGEAIIWSLYNGQDVWNDEERWREACEPITSAASDGSPR